MTNKSDDRAPVFASIKNESGDSASTAAYLAEMDRADMWAGIKVALAFAAVGGSVLALIYFTHTVQAGCLYYLGL